MNNENNQTQAPINQPSASPELITPQPVPSTILSQPKTPWYKKKKVVLPIVLVVVLAIAAVAYAVFGMSEDAPEQTDQQSSQTQDNNDDTEAVAALKQVDSIEGLKYVMPKNWTVATTNAQANGEYYELYSDDAARSGDGFDKISVGIAISLNKRPRVAEQEAGKEDPLDGYIDQIGSPKLEPASENSKTDTSKIAKFTSAKGIKMMAFPWRYEGCTENVHFLSETLLYTVVIHTGNTCPDNTILNSGVIKEFIDSLELAEGTPKVALNGAYVTFNYGEKAPTSVTIETNDSVISFSSALVDSSYSLLNGSNSIVRFTDDMLSRIDLTPSRETVAPSYDCEGCGALYLTYDEFITYSTTPPATTGYEKLAENIYGKVASTTPIQSDGEAATYIYIRMLATGAFQYTVTAETVKGTETATTLPKLADPTIVAALESLNQK